MAKTAPAPATSTFRLHLNLLYPQGLPQKFSVKLTKWILSYGRVILIFVEMIVLATFFLRFRLDDQLAELKDSIKPQISFIQSLTDDETQIRQTQFKLATIRKSFEFTPNIQKLTDKLASLTPLGVKYSTLAIDNPTPGIFQFRIAGKSTSNPDLGYFINNLKSDTHLTTITVNNVGLEEGAIVFSVSGQYKP